MKPYKTRNMLKYILRLFVTFLMVALILYIVDWRTSLRMICDISMFYIIMMLMLAFVMITVSSIKWQLFLKARNIKVQLRHLILLYLVGYFFNMVLPSNIGGDFARGIILSNQTKNKLDSFGSVFLERFTGFLGLLIVAIIAFLFNKELIGKVELGFFLGIFVLIFLILIILLFSRYSRKILEKIFEKKALKNLKYKLNKFLDMLHYFRSDKIVLTKAMIISFVFHFLTVINTFVVCMAVGVQASLFDLAAIVPIILITSSIPVSLNSVGVWEGSFVYFFSLVGIAAPAALSVALVLRAKSLITSFIGGGAFIIIKRMDRAKVKIQAAQTDDNAN